MGPHSLGSRRSRLRVILVGLLLIATATATEEKQHRGLFTGPLTAVHETIPRKVTANAEYASHDVTTHHDGSSMVHFNVTIDGNEHFLILQPTKRFVSKSAIVERHKRNTHVRYRPQEKTLDCHFQGVVHGDENSRVAVSACNGLTGLIHTKTGKFFIEPAHHSTRNVSPGHRHLVYKRSAVPSNVAKKRRKKKRRKHASNCGTKEPKRMTELEWQRQLGKLKVQEKKQHKHKHKVQITNVQKSQMKKLKYSKVKKKRSVSQPHYVETLLVADSSMVEFHQDGDIETYILTIMNMVSSLYLDPSIGNYVNVVVVKIILIDDSVTAPTFEATSNADTILKDFCKWQANLNPANDSHPHHHDVAILITRKDICSRQDAPCGTLGVAHVGGMCKTTRSCSVNEDNGITSAHTIAHEMGHNFGMLHDTEKTGCKRRQGNKVHIMTPSFEADTATVSWSNCSKRDITNFLDKGLGECLHDEPQEIEEYEYPELPAGAVYNANYQCRFQWGSDASVCSMEEICSRLWCTVNDSCTTLLRPAASGTNCGKHKWCQDQKCVPIMEPPTAIDGGWGEWGSWSSCSRTCGAGVSVMERECDHPTPASGGKFCVGERKRYRICNTDPCPENQPSYRATQCSSYDNTSYEGRLYEWQPYFDRGDPCQLYCTDVNETIIVAWGDYAADGTSCDVVSRDVCISGICKKVGCDWVVDSTAKEDDCGICQGDGTKCVKVEGVYTKQSVHSGYREIVVIPKGARNVRIEEKDHSPNYISVGSAVEKKFYLNGKRHITLPGEYKIAGTQGLYERHVHLEKIRIPGPIQEAIVVYIFFRGKTRNPGVEYKYSMWKPETTKQVKYSWILDDWSQCSATCGGGVQKKQPQCQESTVSLTAFELERPTIVEDLLCEPSERPKTQMRTCNDDPCPYYWWVGPWQSCPVTCVKKGKKAMKRRNVMCVDGHEMASPDQYCDKNTKPIEYELCGPLPVCYEDD